MTRHETKFSAAPKKPGVSRLIGQHLHGEILRFLLVGGVAAMADLGLYLLLGAMGLPNFAAKLASFVAVGLLAYGAHKTITFRNHTANHLVSIPQFVVLYAATLGLNVIANEALLTAIPLPRDWRVGLAWLGATGLSASVNFLGGKLIVFRH